LTPDVEAYLAKAKESLASAEADLVAARFNSAANRAYYSVFQAAVAALLQHGVRPRGASWDHKFVISEFSSKLVRRRKIVSSIYLGVLDSLFTARLFADYRAAGIARGTARRSVAKARELVSEISGVITG
jgi:uncharacterized protein (UPF0332 family)